MTTHVQRIAIEVWFLVCTIDSVLLIAESGDGPAKLGPEVDTKAKKLSNLYVLKGDKAHLVSVSEEAAEICVWNAIQQTSVRRIYGKPKSNH